MLVALPAPLRTPGIGAPLLLAILGAVGFWVVMLVVVIVRQVMDRRRPKSRTPEQR